ncbi:MAG TPA: hypothetical protein VGU20_26010 [Stellaceae bacterium]|nr:hypothetical protein [Stellaceae bacterium]
MQQIGGWRARSSRPLPAPDLHWDGEPYWNVWRLVAWEMAIGNAARIAIERRRVEAIMALFAKVGRNSNGSP